ncbi:MULTISPECIES: ATP-binding protein [Streptomyces]|uniref:ATP-binding protein n=1 Tax=Streptomyces TaxID=1883 RepID=UPI0005BDFEFE|nr:ATP-binding protein [Streptomyces sp. NRRL F-5193]
MPSPTRRHIDIEGPHAARRAREEVRRLVRETAGGDVPPRRTAEDDAALVVSEVVTNAVRHGGGVCALDLAVGPDGLDIAVTDRSTRLPYLRRPSLTGEGGLGLGIVARLADAVTTCAAAGPGEGKAVHVHLRLS